ncbi:hypothetical protein ANCDUO_14611 [Ancylostoma duodenale]|uniref:DNA2/NAM7 helicase helicase domain-containing protein n=1 Tax=Ancylostoma duodenale TaxID=51022 RepID=A0A0C2GDR4_9BILA|nr:hypothetical protein ANCDUO_14611 [Ancylostoma duodenale]
MVSLLNISDKKGIFTGAFDDFFVLFCDEASQMMKPVFVAIANRLPQLRRVYIGDIHQLEIHVCAHQTLLNLGLGALLIQWWLPMPSPPRRSSRR